MASKKMRLGKRLRGPSLQLIGGTATPALTMSAGAAAKFSSSGRGVGGAGHLVVAVAIRRRVAVRAAARSMPDR